MTNIIEELSPAQLSAIRHAYLDHMPLKEIAARFGLKRWELSALTRQFREEANSGRRRPRLSYGIERIALPTRKLAKDGAGWHYGTVTLARNSMHVQVLRERGHAEI